MDNARRARLPRTVRLSPTVARDRSWSIGERLLQVDAALASRGVHDLQRLRYFLAVARERNFTRAAARLHIAQPALSRQVRLLEQELGVELLYRTTHDVELTQAGEFLLEPWSGAADRRRCAVAQRAQLRQRRARCRRRRLWRERQLRHGTAAAAGVGGAPPEIAVTTTIASSPEILAGVRKIGTFDLGLVRCPTDPTGLEARTVRLERQGLLCRRDHRLASRSTVSLNDLDGETLLLHPREANPGHYDAVLRLCREQGVEPRVLLRTLSFDLAQTPIARGDGVAIVGESSHGGLGDLCWVPLHPRVTLDVVLVSRLHHRPPAAGRLLDAGAAVSAEFGWVQPQPALMPNHAEPMP